jgi:adenine specific DNA methylase Mod
MTELIWEGKYKDGKKVTPIRIALPFQTIETVNESAQQRQKTLDFFAADPATVYNKEWRNRLIWGDKKYVLPSLLPEFAGKINLIYIDPPFNVGADFSFTATIPDNPETDDDDSAQFVKEPSIIEQKAYRDTWGRGLDSYMQWFYDTAYILRELLTNDGCIYVHLDWRVSHYAKTILDELFGYENFRNEIVWKRGKMKGAKAVGNQYGRNHDVILFYSKSSDFIYNRQYIPYDEQYIKERYTKNDNDGKGAYTDQPIGTRSKESLAKLRAEGRIFRTTGGTERIKFYLSDMPGIAMDDVWLDIDEINSMAIDNVGYSTQKPVPLLERIIKSSSKEGDIVLDCFCGSGTTVVVAEKTIRKWITCDLGRFSIHTTRKRLLGIDNLRPFIVQNLGKYERQQWMLSEFENPENRIQQDKAYKHFILELYHAKSLNGYTWLHGAKAGRLVHVGGVDAPVAVEDIKSTIREFWKLVGKDKSIQTNGIDFLGWDFAFDINETAKQFASENKVDVSFKKIPREVLEKKAVEQGDIKFYELASLTIKSKTDNKKLIISLENFIIPPDDVPQEVQGKISHWSQWVDYWAVDWNYRDDTFHNEWQSYRTKQDPKIELSVSHLYNEPGRYTVLVKVIDILGNDTTKVLHIDIK